MQERVVWCASAFHGEMATEELFETASAASPIYSNVSFLKFDLERSEDEDVTLPSFKEPPRTELSQKNNHHIHVSCLSYVFPLDQ
jgi:hypothetical protein